MKKLLTILLLSLAIVAKGQVDTIKQSFIQFATSTPMDGKAYTPVMINGVPNWYLASYFERNADTVASASVVLFTDTIKTTGTYWISGYCNYISGNPQLAWSCTYVNQNGQARSMTPAPITAGDSDFKPTERRLGPGVVKIQVIILNGKGQYAAGGRLRRVQ